MQVAGILPPAGATFNRGAKEPVREASGLAEGDAAEASDAWNAGRTHGERPSRSSCTIYGPGTPPTIFS
jgi:hypothetical protein